MLAPPQGVDAGKGNYTCNQCSSTRAPSARLTLAQLNGLEQCLMRQDMFQAIYQWLSRL